MKNSKHKGEGEKSSLLMLIFIMSGAVHFVQFVTELVSCGYVTGVWDDFRNKKKKKEKQTRILHCSLLQFIKSNENQQAR